MEYEITEQRQAYLDARGFTILQACPGSGKTTSIVKKMNILCEELESQNLIGCGLLCLSFTNNACAEILSKFYKMHNKELLYPHLVCTIDSFITQFIIQPYWYLCDYCIEKPSIINGKEIVHKLFFKEKGDKENAIPELSKYGGKAYVYAPENLIKLGHGYKIDKIKIDKTENKHLLDYCNDVFKYKLRKGVLGSNDALWVACYILKKHSEIALSLASRFPYIIIDEAQDTSQLQFSLFELLRNAGLKNLEFVGDECQAIYEWRDAVPNQLSKYASTGDWKVLPLTENRRSVQRIISLYSRLRPIGYPAIISHDVEDKGIPIEIIRYEPDMEHTVIRRFNQLCKEHSLDSKLILVRGNSGINKIEGKKEETKIWKNKDATEIIKSQLLYNNGHIMDAIKKMQWVIADLLYPTDKFTEKKNYIRDRETDPMFNSKIMSILDSLPNMSCSFDEWQEHTTNLLKNIVGLEESPNFKFREKGFDGISINELRKKSVNEFFGNSSHNQGINTIHYAKGLSVDAVLLFVDAKKTAQGISIEDIPAKAGTITEMKEKERLIYVACSRPRQLLMIAVPSSVTEKELSKRFNGLDFRIYSGNVQGTLF